MKEPKRKSNAQTDPIEFARGIALNALSSRPKSRRELEQQLARRKVAAETAELVLDRLAAVGLIDDREFARAWSQSRASTKGLSRRVLAQELNAKGIDKAIAQEVLAAISPDDEYEAALSVAEKKARSLTNYPRDIQLRRIFDLLARKGFSSSISTQVIKKVLGE